MGRSLRAARWCLVLGLVALALAAAPAGACGCGVYIPREGEARVNQERALIRWDGRTEDILLQLAVEGSSREAAWILPVPARADVQLGDSGLFEALQELTKPRVEKRWRLRLSSGEEDGATGGAVPAGTRGGVTVLERQELGPFDVSLLDAADAGALVDWLDDNGYSFPDGLEEPLRAYVDQGWFYVAIRLTPADGDGLGGALQPIWVTFPSDELVYPMRASSLARSHLGVYLYLLADHRVESRQRFGDARVAYAGWVEPGSLPAGSPIGELVDRRLFLTKIEEQIPQPAQIDGDYTFGFAAQDEVYHPVIVQYEDVPLLPVLALGLLLAIVGLAIWLRRRWRIEGPGARG